MQNFSVVLCQAWESIGAHPRIRSETPRTRHPSSRPCLTEKTAAGGSRAAGSVFRVEGVGVYLELVYRIALAA